MQKLELFDETFDPDRTESYELSIQFTLNGFSFCIKDTVRNCFIALVSSPFKSPVLNDSWIDSVLAIKKQYGWISKSFKKVILNFESSIFTMIPQGLFDPHKSKLIIEQVHELPELYEIRFNNVHDEVTSIFALPSALVSAWKNIHSKTHFVGFSDSVFAYHRAQNHGNKHFALTIAKAEGFIAVILSKGLSLKLCTSIDIHTHVDTVYHLVNMCRNFEIDSKEVSVRAIGNFDDTEQFEILVRRFFADFSISHNYDQNHFSYILSKYKSRYANLFNQSLCEL